MEDELNNFRLYKGTTFVVDVLEPTEFLHCFLFLINQ